VFGLWSLFFCVLWRFSIHTRACFSHVMALLDWGPMYFRVVEADTQHWCSFQLNRTQRVAGEKECVTLKQRLPEIWQLLCKNWLNEVRCLAKKNAQIICSRISWRRNEGCLEKQESNEIVGGVGDESCDGTGWGEEGVGSKDSRLRHKRQVHLYLSVKVMVKCGSQLGSSVPFQKINITSCPG
jgi:hypothetical protein